MLILILKNLLDNLKTNIKTLEIFGRSDCLFIYIKKKTFKYTNYNYQ